MNKPQIIFDRNKKSLNIKNILVKKISSSQFKKNNFVIVIGGDGFMLETLKKNKNTNKQFYGINSGNYGFLMNKFSSKNFFKNIKSFNIVKIHPLQMTVTTKKKQVKKSIN